jgi:hypothetical protein
MSDNKDFPRWLYKGNDLAKGKIVRDEAEASEAEQEGFTEYQPAEADKAAQPKASKGKAAQPEADKAAQPKA